MEGSIRRKGMLYIQQQRFGKRWKKMWCVLHGESRCSVAHLELYEYKQGSEMAATSGAHGGRADPNVLRRQDSKRVILLRDCVSVEEMDLTDCPNNCVSFLVETTEKRFLFAAPFAEFRHWVAMLCELAFPMNRAEGGVPESLVRQQSVKNVPPVQMVENTLYERTYTAGDFPVSIVRTEASDRWQLNGAYMLTPEADRLLLKDPICKEILFIWPYCLIRKFGQDKTTFSFEAGRRCETGEGVFEFATSCADSLFRIINTAISSAQKRHRLSLKPSRSLALPENAPETDLTQVNACGHQVPENVPQGLPPKPDRELKRLTASLRSQSLNAIKLPKKDLVRHISSCPPLKPQDPEVIYAKVARQKPRDQLLQGEEGEGEGACGGGGGGKKTLEGSVSLPAPPDTGVNFPQQAASEPLPPKGGQGKEEHESDTERFTSTLLCDHRGQVDVEESTNTDHIYDDPEGCLAGSQWDEACAVYDDPEEVKTDPNLDRGHADLGSPGYAKDTFLYDNVMTGGQRQ